MKVLQVIESLTAGGAERLVIELAGEYVSLGVDSHVLCLSSPGPWASRISENGIYVGCLDKRPGIDLRVLPRLRKTIASLRPDVVHTHLFTANLWTRLAGLPRRDWGLVVTLHNIDNWRGRTHLFADSLLAHAADCYVGVSGAVTDYYAGLGLSRSRLATILNGIHSNGELFPQPLTRPVPLLRACGRLVEKKGFALLPSVASFLKKRGIDFKMEIIGDGPERGKIEAAIHLLGLADCVHLLGERDDARRLIGECDVFIMPSFGEGLPLVVLEALHAGRPVVTTDLPGLAGVVDNGAEALLVPMGSPRDIAGAVASLIACPDQARAMARAGRVRAKKHFSIERTAASYLDLYKSLLKSRS